MLARKIFGAVVALAGSVVAVGANAHSPHVPGVEEISLSHELSHFIGEVGPVLAVVALSGALFYAVRWFKARRASA
jgi:hypothetical protein